MLLIVQVLLPIGVLATVPAVLVTLPPLTVTDTDHVNKSAEQAGAVDTLMVGLLLTMTVSGSRGPSQLLTVWDTYHVVPVGAVAVAVDGVGAVVLPVPPVAAVYHNKSVPVAVNGTTSAFWQ